MSFTNLSKNTGTFTNLSLGTATLNVISYLLCESGDPLVQENNYYILIADSPGDKHYGTFTNETKN